MKCPFDWTDAVAAAADSVAASVPASGSFAGKIPAGTSYAGRMGNIGDNGYRLERTTPTA